MKRLIVSIAVLLSLVALVNAEPYGAFLTPKLGEIEGESQDKGHNWEIGIPGSGKIVYSSEGTTGASRKGRKVDLGDIVIVKDSDKSSAKLSGFGEIIIVKDVDKSTPKLSETGNQETVIRYGSAR